MAVYKSSHKGSQVDNTVSATLANKGKGSDELPVYLDGNMLAQNITVDDTPVQGSPNPVTSEGILSDAELNIDYSDIQTSMTGDRTKPVSQKAIRDYTINIVNTKQARIEDSDTIEVADNGAVNVTANVLKKDDGRLPFKRRYLAKYEIEENAGVKERILNAKRSTFDRSKFTVVGNPVITDDGIASGFSSSNYLKTHIVNFATTNSWEIIVPVKFNSVSSTQVIIDKNSVSSMMRFMLYNSYLKLYLQNSSGQTIINGDNISSTHTFTTNTNYLLKIKFTGSKYEVLASTNGEDWVTEISANSTEKVADGLLRLGIRNVNDLPLLGSIDLSHFSITADGKEVFSGNKTGIDTIKPDNYEVVGSPNITEDGVASGFSNSDYIDISLPIVTNNITLEGIITVNSIDTFQSILNTEENWKINVYIENGRFKIDVGDGAGWNYEENCVFDYVSVGNTYSWKAIITPFSIKCYLNNINTNSYNISDFNLSTSKFYFGYRKATNSANFLGSIDLNAFKIYIDGNLVYQPCLKIPYTKAKDGNKIVDSEYRDRVKEQYDEEGYTAYYTVGAERDYTVVGSPVISDDGIASGFSVNDYLKTNFQIGELANKSWAIKGKTYIDTSKISGTTSGLVLKLSEGWMTRGSIMAFKSGDFTLQLKTGDNNEASPEGAKITIQQAITYAGWYKYKLEYDYPTGVYTLSVGKEDGDYTHTGSYTATTSNTQFIYINTNPMNRMTIGVGSDGYYSINSIDLSAFSITVDDKLVYRPFIKDAYTLPTKKLSDITYSYEDGPTRCIQKADMSLIQQGICEEGATINFVKPFADTNYYLSCQYTSKAPTGFVATETGDYIAEGGAASATNKDVNLEVYEFIIDQNIADPKNSVIYTGANAGYTPAYMDYTNDVFNYGSWKDAFFIKAFKPCMLNYNGTVAYYLDPNDYTKKLDGTSSDIANSAFAGNGMVEIGEIWISEKVENGKFRVRIANTKISEDFDCFTHTKKSDGSIVPYTYRSLYDGSLVDGKVRSISGLPVYNKTDGNTMVTNAKANGTGWNVDEYNLRRLVNYLLVLMGKSLNTQAAFGNGVISGDETALVNTGTLNNKGMFYGKNDNVTAVKVFHMENYWGNLWKWYNGLMCLNGKVVCKMCEGTWDGSTVDDYNNTGNGFIETGVNLASAGGSAAYIRRMKLIPKLGLIPMETTGGGSGTSYSDMLWYKTTQTYGFALFGGIAGDGLGCGAFYCGLDDPLSVSQWHHGCALSYRAQ